MLETQVYFSFLVKKTQSYEKITPILKFCREFV